MASQASEPELGPAPAPAPRAVQRGDVTSRYALGLLYVLLPCLSGAYLGLWFMPFAVGAVAGMIAPRPRGAVLVITGGAVAGWAVALWIMALKGLPVGATARTVAALAGLPPYAAVAIAVTLLLAALQALAGTWLARAVFPSQFRLPFPRQLRVPSPRRVPGQPAGTADQADPQP